MDDAAFEAPETDQPVEDAVTPEVDVESTESESGFETPFNINDVPEDYRSYVEQYNRQVQGAYTKKTQELAEQRKEHEQQLAFLEQLQNDETIQEQLLQNLAQRLGYELDADDLEALEESAEGEETFEDPRFTQFIEMMEQQEQEEQLEQYHKAVNDHFDSKLADFEKSAGHELSDAEKDFIRSHCVRLGANEDGMPPVDEAIEIWQKAVGAAQDRWIESKKVPNVSRGEVGTPQFDFNNEEERRARIASMIEAQNR